MINREIVRLTREIYRELNIDKTIRDADAGFLTYDIGHYVGLRIEQEYELLTMRKASRRQRFLLNHLREIRPELQQGQRIRNRAALNGHFQELKPPEW